MCNSCPSVILSALNPVVSICGAHMFIYNCSSLGMFKMHQCATWFLLYQDFYELVIIISHLPHCTVPHHLCLSLSSSFCFSVYNPALCLCPSTTPPSLCLSLYNPCLSVFLCVCVCVCLQPYLVSVYSSVYNPPGPPLVCGTDTVCWTMFVWNIANRVWRHTDNVK